MELAWLCVAGQVAGWGGLAVFFAWVRWGVDLKWRGALSFVVVGRAREPG